MDEKKSPSKRPAARYPEKVTPYYASLIDPRDPDDPLGRMVIPSADERLPSPHLSLDPLLEARHTPVPRLIRRYPDRALLLVTGECASYCRFCFRKRILGKLGPISKPELDRVVEYLSYHPQVSEVLVSGGDPLTLGNARLDAILSALRSVRTIEVIRVSTRMPAVLPSRITKKLAAVLAKHHPLYVTTHFNHPREVTRQAERACAILADAGLPLANQTVLLRGVNNSTEVLGELFRKLLRNRVRPYYLFQCDLVEGAGHFRTPIAEGIEIMSELSQSLSGLALPKFVVDLPGGSGKVQLDRDRLDISRPGKTLIRGLDGRVAEYPDILR